MKEDNLKTGRLIRKMLLSSELRLTPHPWKEESGFGSHLEIELVGVERR